ncbi:response regulator [soil metagenome]
MESKVVLIVDDSEDNRFLYQTILTYAGYGVLEARQGAEGVELAREYHPNLVLMDIHMPVLDGWGATRQIKGAPDTADIPVLAVTADSAIGQAQERVRETGFCGCLHKPCTPSVLLEEVRNRIGPP